jgi:hypothetical protein
MKKIEELSQRVKLLEQFLEKLEQQKQGCKKFKSNMCSNVKMAFTDKDWKIHFGSIDEQIPPLPKNIIEILNSPCPFYAKAKELGVKE